MAATATNALNISSTGIVTFDGTSAFTGSTVTQYGPVVGGASNALATIAVGSAGQFFQSSGAGVNPVWSTATLPSTASGTGTILRADGTNWAATTSTYPNTNAASTLLYASSANVMGALATGNNGVLVTSNSGVPSILAGGTTGQMLQAGTAAAPAWSTSTYPATNAVSTLLYASSANVMGALATANSAILATNSSGVPSITTASGNWRNTSRSAVLAYPSVTVNNVTGDNTVYTIIYNTAVFDQGSDLNTGTGVFTAPVTGRYLVSGIIVVSVGNVATTDVYIQLVASSRTMTLGGMGTNATTKGVNGFNFFPFCTFIDMTAADTFHMVVAGEGSSKTTNLVGGAGTNTTLSVTLIC